MSERKAKRKCVTREINEVRRGLMKKYGLKARQLSGEKLAQFAKCTDLGMEILLIIMRLERTTNVTQAAKAGRAKRDEIRRARMMSAAERAEATRARRRVWHEMRRWKSKSETQYRRVAVPVIIVPRKLPDEQGWRVERLLRLAENLRVA